MDECCLPLDIDNVAHAYTNLAGLSCVIITDREYPARVAFALINRVLEEFMAEFPRDIWLTSTVKLSLPKLKDMIVKYQNPHEADPIMRVQKELDETKVILVCCLLRHGPCPHTMHARAVAYDDEFSARTRRKAGRSGGAVRRARHAVQALLQISQEKQFVLHRPITINASVIFTEAVRRIVSPRGTMLIGAAGRPIVRCQRRL